MTLGASIVDAAKGLLAALDAVLGWWALATAKAAYGDQRHSCQTSKRASSLICANLGSYQRSRGSRGFAAHYFKVALWPCAMRLCYNPLHAALTSGSRENAI